MDSALVPIRNGVLFSLSSIVCFGIAYAAIIWPSAPAGETTGGKYSTMLVPSGAIMAFNLSSCPTGWKAADGGNSTPDLRGTFVRGIGGSANGRDSARTLADYQLDAFQGHWHKMSNDNGGYGGVVSLVDNDNDPHQTWTYASSTPGNR